MTERPTPTVRPLTPADEPRWRELFRAYREFYRLEASEEVVSRTLSWLLDPAHECEALVAEVSGEVVGFCAHLHRRMPCPSLATDVTFLDDLFTAPESRGAGVGRALIGRLTDLAHEQGRTFVQWATAADNLQAQALYNTLATRTSWVTYEAAPTVAA